MKLNTNSFDNHLKNKSLAPVYLLSGDEILLVQEAKDALYRKARAEGFTERKVFYVTSQFDWGDLLSSGNSLSLFSEKNIIELHIPTGKVGVNGKKALLAYFEQLVPENLLVIVTNKLDSSTQKVAWVKKLESCGIFLQIWPISPRELPNWIRARLTKEGLRLSSDAVAFLAEQCEGNLLAAKQMIEKLVLMTSPSTSAVIPAEIETQKIKNHREASLELNDIIPIVSDQGHYNLFEFIDYVLLGDIKHTLRILKFFQEEGTEPILVLWALTRELRTLVRMKRLIDQGQSISQALFAAKVWKNRQSIVSTALKRYQQQKKDLSELLQLAYEIDLTIKGIKSGNVWELLERLSLQMGSNTVLRLLDF